MEWTEDERSVKPHGGMPRKGVGPYPPGHTTMQNGHKFLTIQVTKDTKDTSLKSLFRKKSGYTRFCGRDSHQFNETVNILRLSLTGDGRGFLLRTWARILL